MIATAPITVLVDDREKAPYGFQDLGDVSVIRQRLVTGDYSLPFLADRVAVSRKGLSDLYATVLGDASRHRFSLELARMSDMDSALVVVEEDWITTSPPVSRYGTRRYVGEQVARLRADYPAVTWRPCNGRRDAEVATLAFLTAARERLTER